MPRRKEGRNPSSFGKALVNQHRKNLNRAHSSQSELHVTDIIDDDSSRLRSIIDRNELDEFLSEAILKEKSYTDDKKNIYFVDKKTGKKKLLNEADGEHDEIREMIEKQQEDKKNNNNEEDDDDNNNNEDEDDDDNNPGVLLEYELLRIPRRPRWQDYSSGEEFERAEKDSFLEWRRGVARIEEDRQRAAGAKTDGRFILGKEITPFEKNLEIWKQLWRVIERCDILIQIVDARNPLLFRCEDLEKYVAEISKDKICLLVLNKADYLTREARRIWSNYFNEKNIKFIFWSAMKEQKRLELLEKIARKKREEQAEKLREKIKDLKRGITEEDDDDQKEEEEDANDNNDNNNESEKKEKTIELPSDPTELFSREQIFEYVRRTYRERFPNINNGPDHRIQVGMVGFPNVGKSSTINVLMGEKRVSVAPTPGKTKHFQTLNIDNDLCLADCPGLVFPTFLASRAELVINGVLPIDQMKNYDNYTQPVQLVCNLINKEQYLHAYSLAFPDDGKLLTAVQLLRAHARLRGFVKDHGSPDESVSARVLLKDFVNGKLLYCQPPPGLNENERKKFAASYQHGGDEYDQLVMINNLKQIDDPINNDDDSMIKPVKKSQQKKKKKPIDQQNDSIIPPTAALSALSINDKDGESKSSEDNNNSHHKMNIRAIELTMKDEFAVAIDPLSIDKLVLEEGGAAGGGQQKKMTKRAERMAMKEMLHKKKGKREKLRAQNIPIEQVGIRVALRSADLAYRAGAAHTQPVQSTKIPDHMPIGDYQKPSSSIALDEKKLIQQPKSEFVSVSANAIGATSNGISAALASLVQSVNKKK